MRGLSAIISRYVLPVVVGVMSPFGDAGAQQTPMPRVGVLSIPVILEFLRAGLRERGYVEGKNILIDSRSAYAGNQDLRSLAAELVRERVDVIVTFGTPAARAALSATPTIPVVFSGGDPVSTGLADSLVRPGRNGTGVSVVATELTAKRLDLLYRLAPRVRRIAYLVNSSNPLGPLQLQEARKTATVLGVELVVLDARNVSELEDKLRSLHQQDADAVLVTADVLFQMSKSTIGRAVRKARLPSMTPNSEYLDDGVLSSYGPDLRELSYKIADYVDKILKGAKPNDMPIEQLSKYQLIINLKVARELGIHVPQELLYRADKVIQ